MGALLGQTQRYVGMARNTNPYIYGWCNLLLSVCRTEALARISAMNERHTKDTVQYNVELQERERVLDQETKLKAFTLTKFTDRSELEEQAKKKKGIR